MRVTLSPRAEKQLRKLSKVDQIVIARKVRSFKDKKVPVREEKLKGHRNVFRVRVGDYRIVYRRTRQTLYVVVIGHRRDVYRLVSRLFD